MLSISQIFLHIYSIQWCLLLGYSQTPLQLRVRSSRCLPYISAEEVSASTRGAGTTGWSRCAGRSDLYRASGEDSGDIRKGYSEQAHQDVQSSVESPQ